MHLQLIYLLQREQAYDLSFELFDYLKEPYLQENFGFITDS